MKWNLGKRAIWSAGIVWAIVLAAPLSMPLAAQQAKARPSVTRPDGEVWQVIRTNCISCHGIDDYAYYAMDRDGWQKLIKEKHQVERADLSDKDMSTLLDWLSVKFGPNAKAFPRSYVPQEITTFLSEPEGYELLNKSCTTCHDLVRVTDARNSEDQWRVTILEMRARGATISDDEIEHLVEWLGRVLGKNQDK